MREMGIEKIGDIARMDVDKMKKIFGKNGIHFWELANGIDDRSVEVGYDAKSVSNELTYEKDTANTEKIETSIMMLSEKVSGRLRQEGAKGRTITLKIRLQGFKTYTRAKSLEAPTNFVDTIYNNARDLFRTFSTSGKKVRLVGVKVSNLSGAAEKISLFDEKPSSRTEEIHRATDLIKIKFGADSIKRAKGNS